MTSQAPSNGTVSNDAPNGSPQPAQQGPQQKPDGDARLQNPGTNVNGDVAPKKKTDSLKPSTGKKGPPGGFDKTPLPNVPQGFTVRFTFHSAANLPPSDLNTASSDPFLVATLKTSGPKRHKEDPDLVHRTPTIQKTTEPEWQDQWIVANVPPTGFTLKCRLYDEDPQDHDDRLGNVTVKIDRVSDEWEGIPPPGKAFDAKKRVIAKRAFLIKGIASIFKSDVHITPRLTISMEVLCPSDPPYAQMCTLGPTTFVKHFSPMIGRLAGIKVDADEENASNTKPNEKKSQKYDFQANEMQLRGPVPSKLYHRYVMFRPIIGSMFSSKGLRGKVLNKALHKQHSRIYNFDRSTEYGSFEPCSEDASLRFLELAHFDEGGRIFTYVLTLDGTFRFTETGKEFGIDLLSKHTMHSDVATYIACSGEFFIRRLQRADASDNPNPKEKTHPDDPISGGPPDQDPPRQPSHYQLIIDNDSGTYRPDKSVLPDLKAFLEKNFPSLGIVTLHWEEKDLQDMKESQRNAKKKEGRMINVVMNRSQSSISSAESDLDDRDDVWESGKKSKREAAFAAVEDPSAVKDAFASYMPGSKSGRAPKTAA